MNDILKYQQRQEQLKTAAKQPQKEKKAAKGDLLSQAEMEPMEALFKLVHDLPKVELHALIGGCIRPQTFVDLCNEKNISIEHIDFYQLNVEMAFQIFKVTDQLVTEPSILARVTREIVEDYSKHNCRYLELRSTPKIIGTISDKETYIETVLDAIIAAEQ